MKNSSNLVRVIHGANEGHFYCAGHTVWEVARSLRDAFNIPNDAIALVHGEEKPGGYVISDVDKIEFVKRDGFKGGLHDYWSEAEVKQFFSDHEIDELLEAGMQFTLRPTLTSDEILELHHKLRRKERQVVYCHVPVSVDIEDETIVIDGKAYDIDQQAAAIVKCLIEANGERRSQRDIKAQYPKYVINERIDNLIRRKLKMHKSGIGRFIESDTRGFRFVMPNEQRA